MRLEELASRVGGCISGNGDVEISSVSAIEDAGPGDITFLVNRKYRPLLSRTKAAAVIVSREEEQSAHTNLLRVDNPYLALAKVLDIFKPPCSRKAGIHPGAEIHRNASIGKDISIYPYVVIDDGAVIGDRVVLYPGVYIGNGVHIGDDTLLYPNVTVREGCRIGRAVVIHANSVIGSDGFGYVRNGDKHKKIPQIGIVEIEDDVEIGACVTIDRATIGRTVIKRGTKVDNLVQIAHNVEIGEDSIVVALVGIAGSVKIGERVTIAGQAGIADHTYIGNDVTIAARSGVTDDLSSGGIYAGFPAIPHGKWLRAQGIFTRLPEMRRKILELEKRVKKMEEGHKE